MIKQAILLKYATMCYTLYKWFCIEKSNHFMKIDVALEMKCNTAVILITINDEFSD